MISRFRLSRLLPDRLMELSAPIEAVLRLAGLPALANGDEPLTLTTDQLFAFWTAVGEVSSDPGIGLRLGSETRLERFNPVSIATDFGLVVSRRLRTGRALQAAHLP